MLCLHEERRRMGMEDEGKRKRKINDRLFFFSEGGGSRGGGFHVRGKVKKKILV